MGQFLLLKQIEFVLYLVVHDYITLYVSFWLKENVLRFQSYLREMPKKRGLALHSEKTELVFYVEVLFI